MRIIRDGAGAGPAWVKLKEIEAASKVKEVTGPPGNYRKYP
jgi:hypothetical protein